MKETRQVQKNLIDVFLSALSNYVQSLGLEFSQSGFNWKLTNKSSVNITMLWPKGVSALLLSKNIDTTISLSADASYNLNPDPFLGVYGIINNTIIVPLSGDYLSPFIVYFNSPIRTKLDTNTSIIAIYDSSNTRIYVHTTATNGNWVYDTIKLNRNKYIQHEFLKKYKVVRYSRVIWF